MATTEQERLDWEVRKLQIECQPWYRSLDKWANLAVTALAILGFLLQRHQSGLEFQNASIQAAQAKLDATEAKQERDEYNRNITELQEKLKTLQATFEEKNRQVAQLSRTLEDSLARHPEAATVKSTLLDFNREQRTLDTRWQQQLQQVQQMKTLK